MTGGRSPRAKGNRAERAIVAVLQHAGFAAERVPLSGAARGRFGGDVSVPLLGIDRRVEVKVRGNGFREIYQWLNGAELLVVRADRCEPLVVVPLRLATEVAALAERAHAKARAPTAALDAAAIEAIVTDFVTAVGAVEDPGDLAELAAGMRHRLRDMIPRQRAVGIIEKNSMSNKGGATE